uniref:P-type Cu(+) transporter n=1 Tax=Glycine max TaxID=3847 RepID=K7KDU6_SOYBN
MEANGIGELKIPLLQTPEDGAVRTVYFQLSDIKCASCVNSVESVVKNLDGVKSIAVSPLDGRAAIKFDPKFVTVKQIKESIEESGFRVNELHEQDIAVCRVRIKGMACTSCSESVENALQIVEGVKKAIVGLALEEAKVHFDPNLTNVDKIIEAIDDAGFGADLISSGNDANKVHLKLEGVDSAEDVNAVMSSLELAVGVNHVEMDLSEHKVTVSYDPDITGPRSLIYCVQEEASCGSKKYQATLYSPSGQRERDKVISGTINENGCILVKATHVGSDTALSQIVQLVQAAQLAKAPVQKLADHISRVFVPIVVVVALITWLGWFIPGEAGIYPKHWIPKAMDAFELALQFAISVLVVACPCALGLATPTAVMVASGMGASQGVLIKGGDALEKAHKVKIVVFDKTGTLTVGKPEVVSAVLFSEFSMEELCDMTIAVEASSEHPIAKAVAAHAKRLRQKFGSCTEEVPDVDDFEVHMGAGVSGKVGDRTVVVGNRRLMHACNVPICSKVEKYISENEILARTCILVSIDGKIAGAFSVTDPVKPEAKRVISFLHSMGISSIIVTGDNCATATAIANEVGIDEVFAEIDPVGKADKVKDLQMKGMTVAMVGDGINDSPALVAADVGMAIGAGTDIAIEAADIVLVKSSLEDVITAIDLSRKTMSRIRLNYIWALGYNILGMPIAAGVLYPFAGIRLPPWLAGACMAASSLSVVSSSLLLQFYKKPLHIESS